MLTILLHFSIDKRRFEKIFGKVTVSRAKNLLCRAEECRRLNHDTKLNLLLSRSTNEVKLQVTTKQAILMSIRISSHKKDMWARKFTDKIFEK